MTLAIMLTLVAGLTAAPIPAQDAAAGRLAGSEWRPIEIRGMKVPADADMFVRFGGDGTVVGHGGCNRFSAVYSVAGDHIGLGRLSATRMACPPAVMEREARFLDALAEATRFRRDRNALSLSDDAGTRLIGLVQTDAD